MSVDESSNTSPVESSSELSSVPLTPPPTESPATESPVTESPATESPATEAPSETSPKVKSVLEKLGDVKISNKKDLFAVLVKIMEIVEQYEDAKTGTEKKELALSVLKDLIKSAPISDDDKALLDALITDETVSDTIDVIVKVAKGEFEISKKAIKKSLKSCLLSCLKKQE